MTKEEWEAVKAGMIAEAKILVVAHCRECGKLLKGISDGERHEDGEPVINFILGPVFGDCPSKKGPMSDRGCDKYCAPLVAEIKRPPHLYRELWMAPISDDDYEDEGE